MAKKKTKSRKSHRASWKGHLRFGLVSFPVQAFNVAIREQSEIHFHQLHAECHSRIHHQKVCPIHGEVTNDELVSGYEYGKDRYVEIEPEELDQLRTTGEKALTIDAFIGPDELDPIYFDGRMYYLLPDGPQSQEAYAVLEAAMRKQQRYGIGQVVFSGREQLVLVRSLEGVLTMAMLNYDAEIRKPEQWEDEIGKPRVTAKKIQLAESLIETWSASEFDYSEYQDRYREKVTELVQAKIEGREVVTPDEDEEPDVVNLMDALRKSVARVQAERPWSKGKAASRKRPAGKRGASRRKRA